MTGRGLPPGARSALVEVVGDRHVLTDPEDLQVRIDAVARFGDEVVAAW